MNNKDSELLFDIFNVATQDYITVKEIDVLACSAVGVNSDNVDFQYSGGDRGWNGDVPKVLFNTEKIRSLGWLNKFTSEVAISKSLEDMHAKLLLT
jgi:UDP-glucose 4-epimerase